MWHAELFDPSYWAKIFRRSCARYVVLTSKHHEGFTNWRSAQSWNWNSVDIGPHIDIVAAVGNAVRKEGLHFGLYHSLFEWFNPLYLADKVDNTTIYVETVLKPQLHDIVNSYLPDVVWSDGDWEMNDTYWNSTEFLAWLYNESPVKDTVVVNDRWGSGDSCKHGGYYTCDDRFNPGKLMTHKWENCFTIDAYSWGYRRNMELSDVLSINDLLQQFVSTIAFGGNFLLNVGPRAEGTLDDIFVERLTQIGDWMNVNGEAIYSTTPWRAQNESTYAYYTTNGGYVYCIVVVWPSNGQVVLTAPVAGTGAFIEMLGFGKVPFSSQNNTVVVDLTGIPHSQLPSSHAWTLKLQNFK